MKRINLNYLIAVGLSVTTLLFSACSDDESDDNNVTPENVMLSEDNTLGMLLTDKDGASLYYFTKDADGTSKCESGCLANWPVFYEKEIKAASGLSAADFGTITREDGSKQTTYKGWPLYYFSGDANTGDTNGEGVGDVWYVAKPNYTVMIADFEVGGSSSKFIVDAEGNTLYRFTVDEENVSNCEGGCVTTWPLFFDEEITVPSFLNKADFTAISRADGGNQLAYKGQPLYYFASDAKRGEANGQGVNDVWFILDFQ